MNIVDLCRDEMYVHREHLTEYVNQILPKGNIYDELAITIRSKLEVYHKMNGTLYTAIIHDEIVSLIDNYKLKYNIR